MESNLQIVEKLLLEVLDGTDFFIVKLDIVPTNNIKIYLDGEAGIGIGEISKINRSLYKKIEEAEMYPSGDFSLEVSSPGVDEPLLFFKQYKKHVGRNIEITTSDKVVVGKLISAENDEIILEEMVDKKKKITETHTFSFSNILKAIVQISF